jgi:hypothetical protein
MEPSAVISAAKTAMGAGSILLRIGKWFQRVRNGSAKITYPSNRDCIREFPFQISGSHTNLRHGSYWLLLASGLGYVPLQRLSMLPDGKWAAKINYLEHESGNPVVVALAWSAPLIDALLVRVSDRSSSPNNEHVIFPDQRCLRVDEQLVLQIEAKPIPEFEKPAISSRQSLVGIGLTAQEQQFLDARDTSTTTNLNEELLGLLCEQPDAGNFVADVKRLANKLSTLGLQESQISHIIKGDASHLVGNIIMLRRISSHLLLYAKLRQKIHGNLVIPLLLYCSEVGHGPPQYYSAFSAARRIDSFTGEYAEVPDEAIQIIEKALDFDEPLSSPLSFEDLTEINDLCPSFGQDELKEFGELMSAVDPTLKEVVKQLDEIYTNRHKRQDSNDS